MRALILLLASAIAVTIAGPAAAQSATKINQFNAWGTYSYQGDSGKVCYVLSVPTEKQPQQLDHGDIFFFVSQKPGQNVAFEPQFIASYPFQENSKVAVKVGDRSFSLFTKGKSAWLENAAEEVMSVAAKSGRGNDTSYNFSLRGISAALDSISACK